ncbi:hypothetical protein BGX28_000739 [Mortierella sp. GBA30]|nr:hypothetical protein BGX28_000739 [Mortierella sp. GBA30]
MTKRNSESPSASQDVDMNLAENTAKKVKVDDADWIYPQDKYTIRSEFLKDSRFEILYMATRARAETPRLLLEYIGATYTSATPVEWPKGKSGTPFGLLPVLTHHKPDGTTFTVPEVPALTRYIARLAGLTGDSIEEEASLDAVFTCAQEDVLNVMFTEVWMKPDPSAKECVETAFEKLTPLFDGLERYLTKNGSNGYLVKEKTTYAEFPWYDWMQHFFEAYKEKMGTFVSETVRPGCYKLFKRLDANPRIRAYIEGGRWEYRPAAPFCGLYSAGVISSDWKRSFEFYNKTLGFECVLNVQPAHCSEGGRYMEFKVNGQEKTKFTVYSHGKDDKQACESKSTCGICFGVRSVQETFDRLVKKGVEFKIPPSKMPWGSMAQLCDPDGLLTREDPNSISGGTFDERIVDFFVEEAMDLMDLTDLNNPYPRVLSFELVVKEFDIRSYMSVQTFSAQYKSFRTSP